MKTVTTYLCAGAIAAVAGLPLHPAEAQTKWDLFAFTGVGHPITEGYEMFAEEVAKATDGQLEITVRPAGELPFKATEVIKATSSGQVQLGAAYQGFISGALPIASIASLPFLVRNAEELEKVAPKIVEYTDAALKDQGVRTLYWHTWPTQNIFGRGEPIRTLADFEGRKIRSTDAKQVEMLSRLGASSVSLTTAEVPVAVERGLADGYMTAAFNVVGAKWDEFTDWGWMADVHMGGPEFLLMNVAAYEALPEDVRAKLDQAAADFAPKVRAMNLAEEDEAVEALKSQGATLVEPSEEEVAQLVEMMTPYWETWAESHGEETVKLLDEMRSALGK